jgi:hypothetical protein
MTQSDPSEFRNVFNVRVVRRAAGFRLLASYGEVAPGDRWVLDVERDSVGAVLERLGITDLSIPTGRLNLHHAPVNEHVPIDAVRAAQSVLGLEVEGEEVAFLCRDTNPWDMSQRMTAVKGLPGVLVHEPVA